MPPNCNKRSIETLAQAGAFDCFPQMHRAQFFITDKDKESENVVDKLISYASKTHSASKEQFSIFDMDESVQEDVHIVIPQCDPWDSFQQNQLTWL